MSTLARIVQLAENALWIVGGALLDVGLQMYHVLRSRFAWLYLVLLVVIVLILTVFPHA